MQRSPPTPTPPGPPPQGLADGVKLLAAAFQLDPSSAPAMRLLAQVCLMRGEYDKARALAEAGAAAADSSPLRASCHALAGRACHALGLVQEAAQQYAQVGARGCRAQEAAAAPNPLLRTAPAQLASHLAPARPSSPAPRPPLVHPATHTLHRAPPAIPTPPQASAASKDNALAHLGQAQVWMAAGEPLNAATELEAALQAVPGCRDALKLLAGLKGQLPPRKAESLVQHFKVGTHKQPDDPEAWAMLGELLAGSDPAGAAARRRRCCDCWQLACLPGAPGPAGRGMQRGCSALVHAAGPWPQGRWRCSRSPQLPLLTLAPTAAAHARPNCRCSRSPFPCWRRVAARLPEGSGAAPAAAGGGGGAAARSTAAAAAAAGRGRRPVWRGRR